MDNTTSNPDVATDPIVTDNVAADHVSTSEVLAEVVAPAAESAPAATAPVSSAPATTPMETAPMNDEPTSDVQPDSSDALAATTDSTSANATTLLAEMQESHAQPQISEALADETAANAQTEIAQSENSTSAPETAPIEYSNASATPVAAAPIETKTEEPARSSKPLSMEQVMESDEFSSYMSGVDALQRGALMPGTVVRVDENTGEVLVDIGAKSEGIIARNEVGDEAVNVGDAIEVVVLRPEDDEGHPVVSKRRADYEKIWRVIQQAKDKNTDVEGLVREQVKGGLIVDLGVPAFVPASHVDTRNRSDLSRFVGRTIPLRVIEIDRKRNKVIGSHRLAVQEDREKREADAWAGLEKDKIVEGVVRRITDFGAFIDIGGIDGLLHVREMGWSRVEHPDSVVKKGQKLQVLILEIDEERKRVALGLKQLQSDPWKKAAKNFRIGQMVKGKVVRLAPSVAFVELEDGVEGIIPVGEISETRINEPGDVLTVGQEVEARIKQIQTNQRRISLSLKAAVQEREVREVRTQVREVNQRAMGGGGGNNSGGSSSGGNSGGGGGNSGGGFDDGGALRLGDIFGQQLRAARDRGKERNEARSEARARAMQAAAEEEDDFEEVDGFDATEETDVADEVVETETDVAEVGVITDGAVADGAVADGDKA